ncbi:MAG: collagen binding domain-containing protein [Bryobacteraceae bacterium]
MLALTALAQAEVKPASLSGVVREAATGAPARGANVLLVGSGLQRRAATDAEGRYEFSNLPEGRYTARAFWNPAEAVTRIYTLAPGEPLTSADFVLAAEAGLSGRVTDDNGEPMANVTVYLVGREYQDGALRYTYRSIAMTDDDGAYRLSRIVPGTPYAVLARREHTTLQAVSDVPAAPKLRRPVPVPTYYPGSETVEGAQWVILQESESREQVDLRMRRSPSYCIEGVLQAAGRPASLRFEIFARQPSRGNHRYGGFMTTEPGGVTAPDGRLRLCDLTPGEYQLMAHSPHSAEYFGTALVTITDRDVEGVVLSAVPRLPLTCETVWDQTPPEDARQPPVTVSLSPLRRAPFADEGLSVRPAVPGTAGFPGLLMDEYSVAVSGLSGRSYVKDILYGGKSIRHAALHLGSGIGNAALRVVLGHDGGTFSARVADRDGGSVAGAYVYVIPRGAACEPELSDTVRIGQVDQHGFYRTGALAPGPYLVLASGEPFDPSPEGVARLWRVRLKAREVEIAPGGSLHVDLQPAAID